jgi:hypothetical protein
MVALPAHRNAIRADGFYYYVDSMLSIAGDRFVLEEKYPALSGGRVSGMRAWPCGPWVLRIRVDKWRVGVGGNKK